MIKVMRKVARLGGGLSVSAQRQSDDAESFRRQPIHHMTQLPARRAQHAMNQNDGDLVAFRRRVLVVQARSCLNLN